MASKYIFVFITHRKLKRKALHSYRRNQHAVNCKDRNNLVSFVCLLLLELILNYVLSKIVIFLSSLSVTNNSRVYHLHCFVI